MIAFLPLLISLLSLTDTAQAAAVVRKPSTRTGPVGRNETSLFRDPTRKCRRRTSRSVDTMARRVILGRISGRLAGLHGLIPVSMTIVSSMSCEYCHPISRSSLMKLLSTTGNIPLLLTRRLRLPRSLRSPHPLPQLIRRLLLKLTLLPAPLRIPTRLPLLPRPKPRTRRHPLLQTRLPALLLLPGRPLIRHPRLRLILHPSTLSQQ